MKVGTFCISIDHELLWGRKDLDYKTFIPKIKRERAIIKKLILLFKKYDIPTTWAVVGKIFEKGDPLWHGLDTIREISKLKNQELASHSYSHNILTEVAKNQIDAEMKNPRRFKSFIFPRNQVTSVNLLKKNGFVSFRGKDNNEWELLALNPPPAYQPSKSMGIVNIRGSLYFVSGRGLRKYIPKGLRFMKAKMGMDNAIKQNAVFHLWFHPVDFADDTEKLFLDLENILKYADSKRKEGLLEIKTMSQIAKMI